MISKKKSPSSIKNREELKQQIKREIEDHRLREELIKEVMTEMGQEEEQKEVKVLENTVAQLERECKEATMQNEDLFQQRVEDAISEAKRLRKNDMFTKKQFFAFINRLDKLDD